MPQLLIIKDANTPSKKVGDIVGVFEDAHKFSEIEKDHFYIEYVAGFDSAAELRKVFNGLYEIQMVNRLPVRNKWTFDMPEHKEVWRELPGGKWYDYTVVTKFKLNYHALTAEERGQLALEELTLEQRIERLKKCENRIKAHAENLKEELDLKAMHI